MQETSEVRQSKLEEEKEILPSLPEDYIIQEEDMMYLVSRR